MTALSDAVIVHVSLAYCGFGMAVLAGIPLAVLSLRSRYAAVLVSFITGIGQAIPIFALVAFIVPLVGIGFSVNSRRLYQYPAAHCPQYLCRHCFCGSGPD